MSDVQDSDIPQLCASEDEQQDCAELVNDADRRNPTPQEVPDDDHSLDENLEHRTTTLPDQFVRDVLLMAAAAADSQQLSAEGATDRAERPILELLSATLIGAAHINRGTSNDTAATTSTTIGSNGSDSEGDAGILVDSDMEEDEDRSGEGSGRGEEQQEESDNVNQRRRRTHLSAQEPNLFPECGDSDEEAHASDLLIETQNCAANATTTASAATTATTSNAVRRSVVGERVFNSEDLALLGTLHHGASTRLAPTMSRASLERNTNNPPAMNGRVVGRGGSSNVFNYSSENNSPDDNSNVRIRVPIQFLDASATSSSAPRQQQQQQQHNTDESVPFQYDPEATSRSSPRVNLFSNMSTTTSQQVTPDARPMSPMRPRPSFARTRTEPRRVAYPTVRPQNQQQTSILPDPLQFVQSLVSGSLFDQVEPNNDESETFQFVRASLNNNNVQQRCTHGIDPDNVYSNLFSVPLNVCGLCNSAIIAPNDRNENCAKALRFPESMKRDNRFQELFDMHREHTETINSIKTLLEKQHAISLRLFEWHRHYSDRLPCNYTAQNNPCYRELSRSLDRHSNALQAFCNMSEQMATAHRRRFIKAVHRTFPRNQAYFKAAMRYEIHKAQPNPILLPGSTALPRCTVCDEEANVRLHTHTERYELVRLDPFATEPTRQVIRECQCQEFVMCLDCLLDWYYDSSEKLTKSFAKCPTCKAQFHLEDVVRVRTMTSANNDNLAQNSVA